MNQIQGVAVDYRGLKLCDSCWNGNHYITDEVLHKKVANCIGGECQCPCRELLKPVARVKKSKADQTSIPMDDALEIR